MTEVWFYVSEDTRPDAPGRLLMRLLERARQARRQVYLNTSDANAAARLDQWLWQDGFVPHGLPGEPQAERQPVLIGYGLDRGPCHDLLINLDPQAADDIDGFARVIELVAGDEDRRRAGRERWKSYRNRGYAVTRHDLPSLSD
ncbi:MAG: DNA polymerase III subunit chi [Alcanivoracaceae bacterium]